MNRITERIAWSIAGALGIAVVALLGGVVAAGPLTPPGPPAATQETLIFQPALGCAGFPINLNAPGSYKLASNISNFSCATDGIRINSQNVHLDLNGFVVEGAGPALNAIGSNGGGYGNSEVVNGSITGWAGGIALSGDATIRVDRVDVTSTGGVGISVGQNSMVSNCSVRFSVGSGIVVGAASTVSNCIAQQNGNRGIDGSGYGTIVADCVAYSNVTAGVFVGSSALVSGCETHSNTDGIVAGQTSQVIDCVSTSNQSIGITVGPGSIVERCTASINGGDGIRSGASCYIANNNSTTNGTTAVGAGIHVTGGTNCRIEGNNASGNDMGFDIDTGGATVFRNSAHLNGAAGLPNEYTDIVAGNDVGPIGPAATSTSPWANIAY